MQVCKEDAMKNKRKIDPGKLSNHFWPALLFPAVCAVSLGAAAWSANAVAYKPGCDAPPCKGPPPVGESAANNLSFPAIMSEGVTPFNLITDMEFAPIEDTSECTTGTAGGSVPVEFLCYFDDLKVWWLQQRTGNAWQAYAPADPDTSTPVDVTAVDVGDKLESALDLKSKQIRTEFTLLMDASSDPDFADGVLESFDPELTANTFQAFNMSGAVPGTDQSIDEIQGTDFGPGPEASLLGGTLAMVDPTLVKLNTAGIPVHATVYSHCARLLIQKITDPDNLAWSSDVDDGNGRGGYWVGGALPPQENLAAWDGSYSAEINAGGTLIYGFNWNTKLIEQSIKSGTWRLSFVLEGGKADSGKCSVVALNTVFESTVVVNTGEQNQPVVLTPDDMVALGASHGEGGMVYIDIPLAGGGGGKRN
jgi:hypothetical protein